MLRTHLAAAAAAAALIACSGPGADVVDEVQVPDVDILVLGSSGTVDVRETALVPPGDYVRRSPGADGVIRLAGLSGVTLDLSDVTLRGAPAGTPLDAHAGVGVLIEDCDDIRIQGGTLGGYKVCIAVRRSTGIVVDGVRFDGWFGQRLRSTAASEDQTDWLRPHENDDGEWEAKYGGAISVADSRAVTIAGCRGRHGQNGILFTRVEESEVHDNDFSFLSGWGLALYRSSKNVVAHNLFDYCIRGYSHDVYWRGQDSAGILMFERCCDNLIARNSATHGGDGVFLFAGQDIVEGRARERGEADPGGSDRNVFYQNDLRYAVANALEATFSSGNIAIENDLSGCHQHGVWGGYSNRMVILRNVINDTVGGAVTIEHGQDCVIAENRLSRNEMGVELYWDADPHLVEGPFGRHNETSSRGHTIIGNEFVDNVLDLVIRDSEGLYFHGNTYAPGDREPYMSDLRATDDASRAEATVRSWLDALDGRYPSGNVGSVSLHPWNGVESELLTRAKLWSPPQIAGSQVWRAEERNVRRGGLETIVMGEWGPWDYESREPRPEQRAPGGLLADTTWRALWFRWDETTSDPRTQEDVWRSKVERPLVMREVPHFTNPWGGPEIREAVGNDLFGLFAATRFEITEPGSHQLTVVSDDGIRVWVDDDLVVEDWTHHAPKRDEVTVELAAGAHVIRVEYFQIHGAAALTLDLEGPRR